MMNEELRTNIETFCEDNGYGYRDDYSGRGMFGRTCVGITCDEPMRAVMELTAYLMEAMPEAGGYDLVDTLGTPKMDSMGCSSIVYFPNLEVV